MDRVIEPPAGTVRLVPSVTVQIPPLLVVWVSVTPDTSEERGLLTAIVPVVCQSLSVPASCVTRTP